VLSIDTGKHFAAALLSYKNGSCKNGLGVSLDGMYYQHQTCFMSEDVTGLCTRLAEFLEEREADLRQVDIVIELPSHRYFGRGNASAVLKAMWQGIRIMMRMAGHVRKVVTVPADEWNKQRGDKEKKTVFNQKFKPEFKDLPYYQDKHGSRSNAHERDASLLALYFIDRKRKGLPFRFN